MAKRENAPVRIRELVPDDVPAWLALRQRLWPDTSRDDLRREQALILDDQERNGVLLAVSSDGAPSGFAEVSLRDWAEGCSSRPVGYLEGWYVEPEHRRAGVGRALLEAAECWVRSRGCTEMGSDAELDDHVSHRAHRALGFTELGGVLLLSKRLVDQGPPPSARTKRWRPADGSEAARTGSSARWACSASSAADSTCTCGTITSWASTAPRTSPSGLPNLLTRALADSSP